MDGIFLFDKPILWTSHDVVDFFRRRLGQRKIGHAGTLDPMATGLLILLVGNATRASASLSGLDKDYRGVMTLGVTTDSQDFEGRLLTQMPYDAVTQSSLESAFAALQGESLQTPPAFSSVKIKGKKLYEWARKGVAVTAEARPIVVKNFKLLGYESPDACFSLSCSKGTYVRALCDDVGRSLGCGAALSALVRTRIGKFRLADALRQEEVSSASVEYLSRKILSV